MQYSFTNTGIVVYNGRYFNGHGEPDARGPTFTVKRSGNTKIKCYEISATPDTKYATLNLSFRGDLFAQQEATKGKNSNVRDFKCNAVRMTFCSEAGKFRYTRKTSSRSLIIVTNRMRYLRGSLS